MGVRKCKGSSLYEDDSLEKRNVSCVWAYDRLEAFSAI